MTIRDFFRITVGRLSAAVDTEAEATARIIFEDVAGYDRNYIFADGDREILDFTQSKIERVVEKVIGGEPVQYAVGKARFMGMDFNVSPAVLIPRPETEGLVDLITDRWGGRRDLRVLDLCTGSGCIAIALARALPYARVEGVDISADALAVAKKNAADLHAPVSFCQADVFKMNAPEKAENDIIVSNPPYVAESEKAQMDARVLRYEPSLALFVPDSDPLKYYDAIAGYACASLRPGGMLYFEINPLFSAGLSAMLKSKGFDDMTVLRDYRGTKRYATAVRPSDR